MSSEFQLSYDHQQQGNLEEAEMGYERVLEQNREHISAKINLGFLYKIN